jgi:hypothetical protein
VYEFTRFEVETVLREATFENKPGHPRPDHQETFAVDVDAEIHDDADTLDNGITAEDIKGEMLDAFDGHQYMLGTQEPKFGGNSVMSLLAHHGGESKWSALIAVRMLADRIIDHPDNRVMIEAWFEVTKNFLESVKAMHANQDNVALWVDDRLTKIEGARSLIETAL